MLKKCEEREVISASVAVIEAEKETDEGVVNNEGLLDLVYLDGKETYRDVTISDELTFKQRRQAINPVTEFKYIFTEKPGNTKLEVHKITLTTKDPVRVKQYLIPYAKRADVQKEVEMMLEAGVIEPATSEYNSQIVMVKKQDNTNRFCLDFRRLNSITKFDTEPMGISRK